MKESETAHNLTGQKLIHPAFLVVGINAILLTANLIAVISGEILRSVIRSQAASARIAPLFRFVSPVMMPLSFIVPIIVGFLYFFPVVRITPDNLLEPSSAKYKKRLLNGPLFMALLSILGWMIIVIGVVIGNYLTGMGLELHDLVMVILENILSGIICFVISYNIMELVSQNFVIPRYFPDNKLSDYQGGFSLSLTQKFFIHFLAVSIFPIFLLFQASFAHYTNIDQVEQIYPILKISLTLILIGIVITFLMAYTYRRSLIKMQLQAERVQSQDFEGLIPVSSIDEFGQLAESMNEMTAGLKEREFIKDTFGKVVDPRVRDHLLTGNINMGGELVNATLLFCDIRGFTPTSEKLPPDRVVDWLNDYFEVMSRCIEKEGGVVNKYIGDAILAIFGVPVPLDNPALAALKSALAMQEARTELNSRLEERGLPSIQNGIGIHSGQVLAGNIGAQRRMEYTVIGDAVNIAARVEKLCKKVKKDILFTSETVEELPDVSFKIKKLGSADIRGKSKAITLYTTL